MDTSTSIHSMPAWKRYDPHVRHLESALLSKPSQERLADVLPYGIYDVDATLKGGVKYHTGELIVIQGNEKARKTTMAINLALYWLTCGRLPSGCTVLYETLESGMQPEKVNDTMGCMLATALMAKEIYGASGRHINYPVTNDGAVAVVDTAMMDNELDPSVPDDSRSRAFRLSADNIWVMTRSPLQHRSLLRAHDIVKNLPFLVYGASPDQGNTRVLMGGNSINVPLEKCLPYERWLWAIDNFGVKIILVDHAQAYHGASGFDQLSRVVTHMSSVVAERRVVLVAMSQVSLAGIRSGESLYARGGKMLAEEANVLFEVSYDARRSPWYMTINCKTVRGEPPPIVRQPMERFSGKLVGRSAPI